MVVVVVASSIIVVAVKPEVIYDAQASEWCDHHRNWPAASGYSLTTSQIGHLAWGSAQVGGGRSRRRRPDIGD